MKIATPKTRFRPSFISLLLFAPLLALATLMALPQQVGAEPKWTVQVDPLTTALGFAHIQVERALTPQWSVYVGPHARLFNSLLDSKDEPYKGYGVELGVRRFFTGKAPSGLWGQVRGVVALVQSDISTGPQSAMGGYGSALVGYTAIFGGRWVLAGGAGVQYLRYTIGNMGVKGVLPAAHTTVGVAF
ncbi:MAG: DUF3575 domain-containing protein [Myxococcales bacterium]|nr:DUF3575 domain-containing protein [Myxococcales bacterium]